jgi:hypothetical protein
MDAGENANGSASFIAAGPNSTLRGRLLTGKKTVGREKVGSQNSRWFGPPTNNSGKVRRIYPVYRSFIERRPTGKCNATHSIWGWGCLMGVLEFGKALNPRRWRCLARTLAAVFRRPRQVHPSSNSSQFAKFSLCLEPRNVCVLAQSADVGLKGHCSQIRYRQVGESKL